jgi:outer membrane protein OmpA-like peptidoglycan-associated protein
MNKKLSGKILHFTAAFFFFFSSANSQNELVRSIYFRSNSVSIAGKYVKTLNLIVRELKSDTFDYLKIFAFADTTGSNRYNEVLSQKRAIIVYNYLVSHARLDTTYVYVTWLGKSAEAYDLHFPMAHVQKRCVDIWIRFAQKKTNKSK